MEVKCSDSAEGDAVQVAVRMRVFNQREKDAKADRIIRMTREEQGSKTFITNPETQDEKEFKFDFSFNSHADDPAVGPFATQDTVFNDLGRPVMLAALEGRNICLFAYGQTGAGKSFSMLGKTAIPELQGIIPRTCKAIFDIIAEIGDNPLVKAIVSIQVVEIYCEMVNDLLADRKNWPTGGHKPKLTKNGYEVDTVTKQCYNFDDIEAAFLFADKNRSVGSHALNPESSRAHTIYTIKYEKKTKTSLEAKQEETVTARINLVDLAGSERTESAGTSGLMLKEGNAINLSLTALGNCIHALSEGKRPGFRDSKLTLLLQGAMTNGKVVMIAAVSPASICYEESLSTLRFAERIKLVKIKAKKNVTVDPVAEIKKEMEEMRARMQAEIDELKAGGAVASGGGGGGGGGASSEEVERLKQLLAERDEAERQLKEDYEKNMKNIQMTDEERKREADKVNEGWKQAFGGATMEKKEDIKEPHLLNLNPEPQLAETLIYKLKEGKTVCGRANKQSKPDLDFSGMGMMKDHCNFIWENDKVVLEVTAKGARCLVNGKDVDGRCELKHNNRVWLGNNYGFRFSFPGKQDEGDKFEDPEVQPDYFYAEKEIADNQQAAMGGDGNPLNHQLTEAMKKVEQANIIASDVGADAVFHPKIVTNRADGENQVVVSASLASGQVTWPWGKFNVRLVEMVKLWKEWQNAEANGSSFDISSCEGVESNPFIDDEYQLIGESDVWLKSLSNMIDVDHVPPVLNVSGVKEGQLHCQLCALDKNGDFGPWEDAREELDPFVENDTDMLGKEVKFAVKLNKMDFEVDLNAGGSSKYTDTWIRYKLQSNDSMEPYTETAHFKDGIEVKINEIKKFTVMVDQDMLNHFAKGKIVFQVWGKLAQQKGGIELPPGWKRVTAYKDPDGKLHEKPPESAKK